MRSKKKKIRSKKKKIMISKKIMRSKKNKSIGGSGGLLFKQKNELEGDKLCERLSGNEFLKKCKIILIVGHGALLYDKLKIDKNKIKIIVPLKSKKVWIDPYKTGPESKLKLKLFITEIKKILSIRPQPSGDDLLKILQIKLNYIMVEKIKEIEVEEEDKRIGNILKEITGTADSVTANEVATVNEEAKAKQRLILEGHMPLVNRGLVNEHGIVIEFTLYEEPKDMEIKLLGHGGEVAKTKTVDKKYPDTNYILGFTKDGKSQPIQPSKDAKIKLSSLLEALNNDEQIRMAKEAVTMTTEKLNKRKAQLAARNGILNGAFAPLYNDAVKEHEAAVAALAEAEEEKIIIPLICLEEKSSGIVKVVEEGVTSILGENQKFDDDNTPKTPRQVYNGRERLQPGKAQMQKGRKTSPFKMTPGKFIGEGEQTQATGDSNVWPKEEVVHPTQEQEQEQQPLTLLELFDSSSPPPSPVPRGAWEQTKALLKPREALLHKGLSSPPLWKRVAERKAANSASRLRLTRSKSEGSVTTDVPSSGSGSESSLKRSRSSSINAEINRDAMLTRRPKPPGLTLP